jgi:hypothetical protein
MAKDKVKDRDHPASARGAGQRGTAGDQGTAAAADAAGGQHHAAAAHGRPARIDKSLPKDRDKLIALHAEARRRRASAALGSEAYRAAVDEIARIEIRIADVDRSASPPRG